MFTQNPFIAVTELITPAGLQIYIILMILAVIFGTLFDLLDGKKARFFFQERRRSRAAATRHLGSFEVAAIALRTLLTDIITFGEFNNPRRRISHVLLFYGFLLYLLTTLLLVFGYPADYADSANSVHSSPPALIPLLWYGGILLNLLGGYWFFFFLRVNVTHDGHSPWRLQRADIFIVLLLASLTSALLFGLAQALRQDVATRVLVVLYLVFTTLLCLSVPWSKFAHMFYKPAVALQKRLDEASGASDLPRPQ